MSDAAAADYESSVHQLLQQAWQLPDSPAKVLLLEEAVNLADAHQDVESGFNLRSQLVRAATFGGAKEKALVAFSWQLAQCDRDPGRFSEIGLLWNYKWIVGSLSDFPQITKRQIGDTFADMERRYRRAGLGMRPVWNLQTDLAIDMGDRSAARENYRRWSRSRHSFGADCAACERNFQVRYHLHAGRPRRGLQVAQPLLDGLMGCAEVPHSTYGRVLLPLVRLGEVPRAMAYHQKGYRMVWKNPEFVEEAGQHLQFLTLTDNHAAATRLLERHLGWAVHTFSVGRRFRFYLDALFLVRRLRDRGKATAKLRLPAAFPAHREDGAYDTAALADWFEAEARDLAVRFDERNGNDSFSRRLAELAELTKLITPHPLPSSKRSAQDKDGSE